MTKKITIVSIVIIAAVLFVILSKRNAFNTAPIELIHSEPVTITDHDGKWPDYNILLITVDTLRADHCGCYGYSKNTTPNINALAKQSILFENAYSPAPATIPALRSIMTGRVISNEAIDDIISFYHEAVYLGEIIKKRGYRTAAFTDHLGLGKVNEKASANLLHAHEVIRGFDTFKNSGKGVEHATSHLLTQDIIGWLDENHDKKFFLWAHYFDPHFNWVPSPEYESLFGYDSEKSGRVFNGIDMSEVRKIEKYLTQNEIQSLINLHDAEIFYTDKYIGQVLEKVK